MNRIKETPSKRIFAICDYSGIENAYVNGDSKTIYKWWTGQIYEILSIGQKGQYTFINDKGLKATLNEYFFNEVATLAEYEKKKNLRNDKIEKVVVSGLGTLFGIKR
ncbi:hypothetical protein [Labilibaculum euxinus]